MIRLCDSCVLVEGNKKARASEIEFSVSELSTCLTTVMKRDTASGAGNSPPSAPSLSRTTAVKEKASEFSEDLGFQLRSLAAIYIRRR